MAANLPNPPELHLAPPRPIGLVMRGTSWIKRLTITNYVQNQFFSPMLSQEEYGGVMNFEANLNVNSHTVDLAVYCEANSRHYRFVLSQRHAGANRNRVRDLRGQWGSFVRHVNVRIGDTVQFSWNLPRMLIVNVDRAPAPKRRRSLRLINKDAIKGIPAIDGNLGAALVLATKMGSTPISEGRRGRSGGHGRMNGNGEDVNEAARGEGCQTDNHAFHYLSSEHRLRRFGSRDQSYGSRRRGYRDEVHDGFADGRRGYRNGSQSYDGKRRGYNDQAHNSNDAANGRRRFRNGSGSDDVERTQNGDQVQNKDASAAGGQRRFRNGSWRVNGYQVRKNDAGYEQLNVNGETNEDVKFKDESNGNRNYGGERRGYGRYRGKGRRGFQRTGSGNVKETIVTDDGPDFKTDHHANGSEGNGDLFLKALKEKNISEEVNGGNRKPKQEADLLSNEKWERNKEEEKEATLMTLDGYEKLLLEKRQALQSLKREERRVALDKELEGMRLIERKQEDTYDKQKYEVKLRKKSSLENKEKGRKLVGQEALEFFKPAFRRTTRGLRGGGHGHGDQGGFSEQTDSRKYRDARARQREPSDRDFPALPFN